MAAKYQPRASKRGTALSPCNLVLKPTSGNTEVRARTSIETTAGEIGTADQGMARLAGKRNGSGPGNTKDATVAGTGSPPTGAAQQPAPLLWTGGLRQRSAAISRIQRRCPPCNGEAHGYSGQPLTTALSIAARHWDDKGSQADRRGDDHKG